MARWNAWRRGRAARVGAACALICTSVTIALPAVAQSEAGDGGLPDVDRRFEGVSVSPTDAQRDALRKLGRVEVGWNELGTPHSLRALDGTLTGAGTGTPDSVARGFLREHAELFRQRAEDIDDLRETMQHRLHGATFLQYTQVNGEREVHGSSLLVVLDERNRIRLVGGTLAPKLDATPKAPVLTAGEAVARVALSASARPFPAIRRLPGRAPDGSVRFANTLAGADLPNPTPVEAKLVTVPSDDGGRAAWQVLSEVGADEDYETLVDATTGKILYRANQYAHTGPHGRVHTGDDPEAGGQVDDVPFSGIDGSWVAGTTTAGNNVNAYQDVDNDNTPVAADQPTNADQHFDYTFSDTWGTSAMLPTTGEDRDAVVTQLFYYTNWFHDYSYALGFTETARNFQDNNFGRGGVGGDAVRAEADDGFNDGERNNANFTTNGADGNVPRMQMYVGEVDLGGGMFRRTQRAMNRDTVIHEYAHGITGRVISNSNLDGGVQSGALGEGWSDAFATSINDDPVYGEYNNGDYTNGIRGVAYDDDNLEYGDLCDDGCQVHDDGRIWAMAMWEVRDALRNKHGAAAGKAMHEDLLMTGLFSTPNEPSYHDARTGYLTADTLINPGATNQCLIWRSFADNELGVTAAPDDDDDTTPTVSTDTPDACEPVATIDPPLPTPEGSPVELDASASAVGGDPGDTLTYAWDLNDDGNYDDATGSATSWTFGDNGNYTVSLRVTNTAGYSDTVDQAIVVTNVAPSVLIDPAQLKAINENESLQVQATFTDPGWLDTYTRSVDPGSASLPNEPGTLTMDQEGPPQDEGTVEALLTYGDNGSYTVTVNLADDDGGAGSDSFSVEVANVAPTPTIDEDDAIIVNGVPTIFVDAGEAAELSARVQDPGSDDETTAWDWGDGTPQSVSVNRVVPLIADPPLSPNVAPRDFVTSASHEWAQACMYDVSATVTDDDGGAAQDTIKVLIAATPSKSRGPGYWQHQYKGNGKIDFTAAQLDCYLGIAGFLSTVFNEHRDASTRPKAHDVLWMAQNKGDAVQQLDRQLLLGWLNFANGGVEWDEPVAADGANAPTTAFNVLMAQAEAVRLDPAATKAELNAQRQRLARIHGEGE